MSVLLEWGCTHLAMESTGEYWKLIYAILKGHLELLLVNACHLKHVPGRTTDVKDAEWLADVLRYGLLRGSFVPPQPQRDLCDVRAWKDCDKQVGIVLAAGLQIINEQPTKPSETIWMVCLTHGATRHGSLS